MTPEDFEEIEDMMLHDPEEILNDREKAIENMLNAVRATEEERRTLEKISDINDRLEDKVENEYLDDEVNYEDRDGRFGSVCHRFVQEVVTAEALPPLEPA